MSLHEHIHVGGKCIASSAPFSHFRQPQDSALTCRKCGFVAKVLVHNRISPRVQFLELPVPKRVPRASSSEFIPQFDTKPTEIPADISGTCVSAVHDQPGEEVRMSNLLQVCAWYRTHQRSGAFKMEKPAKRLKLRREHDGVASIDLLSRKSAASIRTADCCVSVFELVETVRLVLLPKIQGERHSRLNLGVTPPARSDCAARRSSRSRPRRRRLASASSAACAPRPRPRVCR